MKKKKKFLYFNLAKVYAPVIFDSGQHAKVYSSRNACHLVIRYSLCKKFRKFFSSRNFLLLKYPLSSKNKIAKSLSFFKLLLTVISIFHQLITLQKIWEMLFLSSKNLFVFSGYFCICFATFPHFPDLNKQLSNWHQKSVLNWLYKLVKVVKEPLSIKHTQREKNTFT